MMDNSIDILQELHQNAIDFAYEANSQRAFADARDGLKPGQRACLWEFYSKGYTTKKPHVKSAKVSGGVISSWWPHGDVAIYETFARMSQPWINNIPEVDWHGANGNQIIGNAVASARYTEARLAAAAEEGMFVGMKKNAVPLIPNFSEDEEWPEVLPALLPRLLVNGCQGIGYTLANHWVPYNLGEIYSVVSNYVSTGTLDALYPDFPTGGVIINKKDLAEINTTGKGRVVVRAKVEVTDKSILITELPYQVFVEPLIDSIKELIESENLTGIHDIYNKSDKNKLLIEVICDEAPMKVLAQLYKLTDLQKVYNPNQYALVGKTPKLLTLKEYFDIYLQHNYDCIRREHEFDLQKATNRKEIVDGLLKALEDIDNIIALIKKSDSASHAKANLREKYGFTEVQAAAIVDMKLGRLAHLEKIELLNEAKELESTISYCLLVINDQERRKEIHLKRFEEYCKKYATPRKSLIVQAIADDDDKEEEVAVEPEKCVVIMTESGLIKRIPAASFKTQKRGGKGVKSTDDITNSVIRTNTVDSLMIFSNRGKMYRLSVNDIPEGTNASKGQSIKSLVSMEVNEDPTVIYSIYKETDAKYVLFATKNGLLKKTALDEYIKTKKKGGVLAINIKDDDELIAVTLVKEEPLVMVTTGGMTIKIDSNEVPATGRSTIGVKGLLLMPNDTLTAILPIRDGNDKLAVFSENGLGKKFSLEEIPLQKRGGKGVICYKSTATSGPVAAASLVADEDDLLIVGDKSMICISAKDIPEMGRAASGNQLIKNSKILSVSKV